MNPRRKLVYYILLNIIISACVSGAILFVYDYTHRNSSAPAAGNSSPDAAAPTTSPETKLEILSVVGAGTAASEIVIVQNTGPLTVAMTGWYVQDADGNRYLFPLVDLYPGGSLQVHTSAGADSAVDLYWDRNQPLWSSGEVATLIDPQGNVHAFYRIP